MYDLVIRNGMVVDGSGDTTRQADVAIKHGLIAAVGVIQEAGTEEIDATGCIVTPGWVDIHTHYDGQVTWDPVLAPSSWHGVTTAVMGNCGVGFAPVKPGDEQFLIEIMEGVEDIPGTALNEGIDWRWEHFEEYLDVLDDLPLAIDVGTQVPHAAVRLYVLGERCNTDYEPNDEELAEMAAIVRRGMEAGALGFSTSRTLLHKDVHGEYMPGTFAGSDEMLAIGLGMDGLKHGVFEMASDHLGDDDEWAWVKEFTAKTGLTMTLVPTSGDAFKGNKMFNMANEAREQGMQIRPQLPGRPTGVLHGLHSNAHIFRRHPEFLKVAEATHEEKLEHLLNADVRAELLNPDTWGGQAIWDRMEGVLWQTFPLGEKPNYEPTREESIAGLAEAAGIGAIEMMLDLFVADGGNELFYMPLGGYPNYNIDYFRKNMAHPDIVFGVSDGGAHCGVIADAGMPTFIMTHWGRDRPRGGHFPVEFLVKKLCRDTALAFGMDDRGLLQEGYLADINVIDFDALQLHRPEAITDLPAGGKRLVQRVDGYRHTIKRGEVIMTNGEWTGATPGQLVRGGQA